MHQPVYDQGQGAARRLAGLTERQRAILRGLALSETVKGLALELHLSPKTVEFHRAALQRRLAIHDLAGLTRFAIVAGLVDPWARPAIPVHRHD